MAGARAGQVGGGGAGQGGAGQGGGGPGQGLLSQLCDRAVTGLESIYDARRGGFGGAPKFPPSMVLEFLLRHRDRDPGESGALALPMAAGTPEAMAPGGLDDT